jgi:hypothetical protein
MTLETIKTLTETELSQVIAWAQQEQQMRADKRKQDTLLRIRELARSIDVGVKIEGTRGRPSKKKK